MSADINQVVLVGRLTRDAELKYSQSGTAFLSFDIAVNRRVKKGETWTDEATFVSVKSAGKAAEAVHKFLGKGKLVGIQGELQQENWEKEGQKRSKIVVFARGIQLLSPREGTAPQGSPAAFTQPEQQGFGGGDFEDSDVPF